MPGHTPGSVGVFVNLPSGKRFLIIGDTSWTKEGVDWPAEKPWLARRMVDFDRGRGPRTTSAVASTAEGQPWPHHRPSPRRPSARYDRRSERTGRDGARRGVCADGAACRGGWKGLGPEATHAAPRRSRPIAGGCCLGDCHSLRRRNPTSRSAPPLHTSPPKRGTPSQDMRGSASPKGEAGATRRQASAKRLARQGGLRAGVGGWCN